MEHGNLTFKGLTIKGRTLVITSPFPLLGHIGFGIIDRGYNNLQVRVTTRCPLSCIFCSVNAGPKSPRITEFQIEDPEWLAYWIAKAIEYKGRLHILFDGAGDPIAHPRLVEHIKAVSGLKGVESIALETRLHGANEMLIDRIADAGVERLNVSIDTLNPNKARMLADNPAYDVQRVIELIKYAHYEHSIDIHITPVWVPGLNDNDIEEIIEWVKNNQLSKKYPPLGIQKYVVHKWGRKVPGVKEWSWDYFFKKLRELEEKHGIKLILSPEDFGLTKAPRIPYTYKKGDVVKLVVVSEGWLPGEYLAVPMKMDRVFTLVSKSYSLAIGDVVKARIIRDTDGIYLARSI